jgi:HK97 gp10 family phage protein
MGEFILKKFGDPVGGATEGLNKGIMKTLSNITTEAKSLTPVDTGLLRNSIMWKTQSEESDSGQAPVLRVSPKFLEGYVGTAVLYGTYIEFGTRKQRPQPYFRPAIALALGKSGQEVADLINKETESWVKGKGAKSVKFF